MAGFKQVSLVLATAGFLTSGVAQATLIDRGHGLVYDSGLNITWLQDANYAALELNDARRDAIILEVGSVGGHALTRADFQGWVLPDPYDGNMNFWGATAWAQALEFGGYSDWRLPTILQPDSSCTQQITTPPWSQGSNCAGGEMGHLFYVDLGGTFGSDKRGTQLVGDVALYNIQANYISGTTLPNGIGAGDFLFLNGWQSNTLFSFPNFAWAVRDGDVEFVPEPTTLALICIGLAGLTATRRKNVQTSARRRHQA